LKKTLQNLGIDAQYLEFYHKIQFTACAAWRMPWDGLFSLWLRSCRT